MVDWMKATLLDLWSDGFETIAAAKQMPCETVEMLFAGPGPYDDKLKAWQATDDVKAAQAKARAVFA